MTQLGREALECDAKIIFSDTVLEFLRDYAMARGYDEPQTLGEAVAMVAIVGGYMNRRGDPPPSCQIMWRGYDFVSMAVISNDVRDRSRALREEGMLEQRSRGSPALSGRAGSSGRRGFCGADTLR